MRKGYLAEAGAGATDFSPRGGSTKFQEFTDDCKIISEPKIDDDIQALEKIGKIADLVDRRIAHLDKRGLEEQVTYNDLEESTNILNKMTCKYIRLITNAVAEYSSLRGNNSMGLGKNIFRSF
jgi:hypothetical protein